MYRDELFCLLPADTSSRRPLSGVTFRVVSVRSHQGAVWCNQVHFEPLIRLNKEGATVQHEPSICSLCSLIVLKA